MSIAIYKLIGIICNKYMFEILTLHIRVHAKHDGAPVKYIIFLEFYLELYIAYSL